MAEVKAPVPAAAPQATPAPQQEHSYVRYYIAGLIIVGIIIAVAWYGKRSGFLVNQPRSDTPGDWSMRREIAKLEERQRALLAKLGKR